MRAAGAGTLLIDLTGNGGGSEWAEAAARMVGAKPLSSEALGFVRGEHWVARWTDTARRLRGFAAKAAPGDRRSLLSWAAEADAAMREASLSCGGQAAGCSRIGRAGFATGLVGSAPAGMFDGRPWGPSVFSPAEYPYHDGVWAGPVIVLVDGETWSAAEEFAAILQDNHAAIVLGNRTGGAGCGHTDGGMPTTLAHSGATLQLPDCIRFRRDGSNEVNGVVPDVAVAVRWDDGAARKAALVGAALPDAIRRSDALSRSP